MNPEPQPQRSKPSSYTPPFNKNYDPLLDSTEQPPATDTDESYNELATRTPREARSPFSQPPATQEVIEIDEASGKVVNVHTEPNPHAQQPPATERSEQCAYDTCTRSVISGKKYCYRHWKSEQPPATEQEWMTRGIVDEGGLNPHIRITVTEREQIIAALAAHVEQDEIHWKTRRTLLKELDAERAKLETAAGDSKHYRELFNEIRIAVRPLTHTDATKKEIIDCVKSLVRQLAAEREKVENLHMILGKKRVEIQQLKQQLALAKVKEGK